MDYLGHLSDDDLPARYRGRTPNSHARRDMTRPAVRAIIWEPATERVAILHAVKRWTYGIAGGGIDPGESPEEALHREILEETGLSGCRIAAELGVIVEHRRSANFTAINYCYLLSAENAEYGPPRLDEGEAEKGVTLEWFWYGDAVRIMESSADIAGYGTTFEVVRDLRLFAIARPLIFRP